MNINFLTGEKMKSLITFLFLIVFGLCPVFAIAEDFSKDADASPDSEMILTDYSPMRIRLSSRGKERCDSFEDVNGNGFRVEMNPAYLPRENDSAVFILNNWDSEGNIISLVISVEYGKEVQNKPESNFPINFSIEVADDGQSAIVNIYGPKDRNP